MEVISSLLPRQLACGLSSRHFSFYKLDQKSTRQRASGPSNTWGGTTLGLRLSPPASGSASTCRGPRTTRGAAVGRGGGGLAVPAADGDVTARLTGGACQHARGPGGRLPGSWRGVWGGARRRRRAARGALGEAAPLQGQTTDAGLRRSTPGLKRKAADVPL